jgi:hypothetical protein
MSVSNLYASGPNGKYINQKEIVVDNLTVNNLLTVEGGTIYEGGIQVNGANDPTKEIILNINEDVLTSIGDTTGVNFEALDGAGAPVNLGAVIVENSSATAGSVIASKISIKPAIPNGATPVISDMLSVGKDLLTTEVGVFAKTAFGAGIAGALGITNVEDYVATDAGKVYKFTLPVVGGNDNLSLVADQIAPSGGAGSPPSVVSSKTVLAVKPVGPAEAPTGYDVYLGDTSDADPNVLVEGSGGAGRVFDSLYNAPDAMVLPLASDAQVPAGFTITTPSYLTPFIATNSSPLNNTTGQLSIFINSTTLRTAPYMLQLVIDTGVAGTVLTPNEAFEIRVRDNIGGGQIYFGSDMVIGTNVLSTSPVGEALVYPTRKQVFSTVFWVNKDQTLPTVPNPIVEFFIRGPNPNTSTSNLPAGSVQLAFFPMSAV